LRRSRETTPKERQTTVGVFDEKRDIFYRAGKSIKTGAMLKPAGTTGTTEAVGFSVAVKTGEMGSTMQSCAFERAATKVVFSK
jgi:hypothetical protein